MEIVPRNKYKTKLFFGFTSTTLRGSNQQILSVNIWFIVSKCYARH